MNARAEVKTPSKACEIADVLYLGVRLDESLRFTAARRAPTQRRARPHDYEIGSFVFARSDRSIWKARELSLLMIERFGTTCCATKASWTSPDAHRLSSMAFSAGRSEPGALGAA